MDERQEDIRTILLEGCQQLGLHVSSDVLKALGLYLVELQSWNRKINLVARKTDARTIVVNHFLDSLVLVSYLDRPGCSLLDIGTGAGFPGLVCKVALPDLSLLLVEPRLKRVSFLRHIVRTLGLEDVVVIADRIEDIDGEKLSYSSITSRAVAELEEFLQMVEALVSSETEIICMKGPRWQKELDQASSYLSRSGFSLTRVEEFLLPFSEAKRAILFFNCRKNR